ncbi:MAG TPA: hypothetical protein VMV72_14950 [Verrucomicrobiae bacterium]|nr:hypothetical protein [Verrucomicrobiae bacterium]
MKAKKWIVGGLIVTTAAVLTTRAVIPQSRTVRTTASITAVYQYPNPLAPSTAILGFETLAGHDIVNLALGTPLATVRTNELLAMDITCGSTAAQMVIFDRAASSNILTIAQSTSMTVLTGQDNPDAAGPNHERFVIQMGVNTNGFLVGGSFTIAGRLYLTPSNGCPATVLIDTDKGHDKVCADTNVKDSDVKGSKDKTISGEAHMIGVANVIVLVGPTSTSTNTFLMPDGKFTMKRILLSN